MVDPLTLGVELSGAVLADINVGLLYVLAISSLGVYGVIIAGWASNSKYPFFSAMRAAAQMVSYEVSIGFILVCVVLAPLLAGLAPRRRVPEVVLLLVLGAKLIGDAIGGLGS